MTLAFSPDETSPYVRVLLADQGIAEGTVNLAIDSRDEMLSFLIQIHDGDRERALFTYFRTGLSIADSMTQILRWRFGDLGGVSLLDFASGYGRVTRFLLRDLPAGHVWVSDVYADGVRFQEERFGVHGIVSTVRPEDFVRSESFDAITVTSLFTHLPDRRFVDWLRVLLGLLRPGGVLIFSVHGEEVLSPDCAVPAEGILFQEMSESGSLDTSDYGSTWVTESYVRAAVARASPEQDIAVHRLPRGLCNFQDLYVAVRAEEGEKAVDFSSLAFQGEPHLHVDECVLTRPDELFVRGWTLARSGGVRAVEVTLDGALLGAAPVEKPRPDVATLFGARFSHPGWSCRCPLPPGASRRDAVLLMRVVDGRGRSQPLSASSIEAALLASSRQEVAHLQKMVSDLRGEVTMAQARAAAEREGFEARIAAMEASRFWKIRKAWFGVRETLGIREKAREKGREKG
jgi:SAM-dependent methyltransferase